MPNYNYNRGVRKERSIVNSAREQGLTALRSAGSHSPVDVVIINHIEKVVRLIQCKPKDISLKWIERILEANKHLNGTYEVRFEVR